MTDTRGAFVLVYSTASVTDGQLARGLLEAEGIPVLTGGMAEGPYRMGPMHLSVPADRAAVARELLEPLSEVADPTAGG